MAELDEKTKAMLKLIEEDADSFAQRAEMYYKKRPELISMVEDFYREYRSLAERYDQLKSDSGNRLLKTLVSPFSAKYQPEKLTSVMDQTYGSHFETYDAEDSAESEVDDPEHDDEILVDEEEAEHEILVDKEIKEVEEPEQKEETRIDEKIGEVEVSSAVCDDEVMKLREEIERLQEENRIHKDQLLQKDEEKREVIRQLSLAVEDLKLDNMKLRKCIARDPPPKRSHFAFEILKGVFVNKFFNGSRKSQGTMIAL